MLLEVSFCLTIDLFISHPFSEPPYTKLQYSSRHCVTKNEYYFFPLINDHYYFIQTKSLKLTFYGLLDGYIFV